jgi:hypothetical protein
VYDEELEDLGEGGGNIGADISAAARKGRSNAASTWVVFTVSL